MKGSKYLSTLDSLQERNRLLGLSLLVLVAINIVNLVGLGTLAKRTQTIILAPGGLDRVQIGNNKADGAYVRRMTRYVVTQVGSYSATTAKQQFQELIELFSPDKATMAMQYFDRMVTGIERYPSISSNFVFASENPIKYTSTLIQAVGVKERYVNGNVVDRKPVHYCIHYHIDEARFLIDSIDEKAENGTDLCFLAQDTPKVAAEGAEASAAPAPPTVSEPPKTAAPTP